MKETDRNTRLLTILDKLLSYEDLETIDYIGTLIENDTESIRMTYRIMTKDNIIYQRLKGCE